MYRLCEGQSGALFNAFGELKDVCIVWVENHAEREYVRDVHLCFAGRLVAAGR